MKTQTTIKFKSGWAVALTSLIVCAMPSAHAQLYWDSNGTSTGAGATPTGTWGTSNFWNTDSTGGASGTFQITTASSDAVVFAAGSDAVNPYTVTLSGTQSASGITFQSAGAATISGGTSLQIGSGGVTATTNATISSSTALMANQTWSVASGKTLTKGGAITGGLPYVITKTGAGTLMLTGSSSDRAYGGITVSQGTLSLAGTNALPFNNGGAGTATTVSNGATMTSSSSVTLDNLILNGGTVTTTGSGLFHLRGQNVTSAVTVAGGANTSTMSGNYVLTQATATKFDVASGATNGIDLDVTGTIGVFGSVNAMNKLGAGVMRLSGSNSYTGVTTVSAGTLTFNSIANVSGGNSALGSPITVGNGTISIGSGSTAASIQYTGVGHSSDRVINLAGTTGNATIDASGSGALVFTSSLTATGAGSKTLTLNGTSTGNNTIGGAIVDNSGTNKTSLTKSGAGKWILSANNTYTGDTTVAAGTLLINGSTASGAVTVSGGTLGGSGTIGGSVTVNSGGTLAPGSSIQSLASGALAFSTGSTFAYEVDSGVAPGVGADLQVVNGTLGLSGTVYLTLNNLSVGTFANNTKFTLINYSGAWNNGRFTYNSTLLNDGDTFTFNGQNWTIDYNATVGGVNFSAEYLPSSNFVNIAVVPEPAAWILAAMGLTTVVVFRRRRVG